MMANVAFLMKGAGMQNGVDNAVFKQVVEQGRYRSAVGAVFKYFIIQRPAGEPVTAYADPLLEFIVLFSKPAMPYFAQGIK
jgi:hypothetical protein